MKRQFFTLVELLVVIVIIAILAGIAFPVIGGMNRKGKETRARAEINAIVTAIKQYEADYGTLPYIPTSNPQNDIFLTRTNPPDPVDSQYKTAYDEVMAVLMNLPPDGKEYNGSPASAYTRPGNVKNKRYLDPPPKMVTPIDGTPSGYYFLDPWGRRYNIALDTGYDGKVNIGKCTDKAGGVANFGGEQAKTGGTDNYLMGKVFVFSYGYKGPADNITNAKKNYITSWKSSK